MNSDKLDKYFKEQIDSLDTVSVPSTEWSPEASWVKINQQSGGRKKMFYWWYLSGVAAVVIILIAFWFSGFNPSQNMNPLAEQNNQILLESKNEESANVAISNQSATEIPVDKTGRIEEKPAELEQELDLQENQRINNKRESYAQIQQLTYLPKNLSINNHRIKANKPQYLKANIEISNDQITAVAFNRTYIIRRNKKETDKEEKTGKELTLRLDLAMSSQSDPPSGILSNRGK